MKELENPNQYNQLSQEEPDEEGGHTLKERQEIDDFVGKVRETGVGSILEEAPKEYHEEIAQKLIDIGAHQAVALNLDKFKGVGHNELAQKLIDADEGWSVRRNLYKFEGLSDETAQKLIGAGRDLCGVRVAENLGAFKGLSNETAQRLIDIRRGPYNDSGALYVVENLDKFEGVDHHNEIAQRLLDSGGGHFVARNLDKFEGLNNKTVEMLLEAGYGHEMLQNPETFRELDQTNAELLIAKGYGDDLMHNIEHFPKLNHEKIVRTLIDAGESYVIDDHLEEFRNLSSKLIYELLSKGVHADREGAGIIITKKEDVEEIEQFFQKAEQTKLPADEAVFVNEELLFKEELEEEDYERLFIVLRRDHPTWQDQDISDAFGAGAGYFGYRKMFKYIKDEDRHDTLYNFFEVIELAKQSGLKPQQFYGQILKKVAMDSADYGDDDEEYWVSSHQYLNAIANAVNPNEIEKNREKAEQYKEIEKLQELVNEFNNPQDIFQDWKHLKKYHELTQLLARSEILDQLKDLKKEGRENLYHYVEILSFHPNIDMQKVFQFWQDPEGFLDVGEVHQPEAHELKKPSNYTEIPYLDLNAENLRDSLVEGDLDKLQDWHPLEVVYQVPRNLEYSSTSSLRYVLAKQLGVADPKIRQMVGIDKDEKLKRNPKLFGELSKQLKSQGLDIKEYLKGNEDLTPKLEQELKEKYLENKGGDTEQYRAKINLKSDPDGVVAGNDTACCMPFGSGKNNVYTYNPATALFTVQRKTDERWKTVAQSVLTKDIDIQKNVSGVMDNLEDEEIHMNELVGENILTQSPNIITCDNVEVTPTFKDNPNKDKLLEYIYQHFFQEYSKRYTKEENLDDSRVIIGRGYTDAITHLDKIDNTFVPVAPVGYSDNVHKEAMVLPLKGDGGVLGDRIKAEVKENTKPVREDLSNSATKGVSDLTFKDSLQVSYLEGKAYQDNSSLMEYLHNMENALIAKDINNVMKSRPNMSLKYVNPDEKMSGYMLAYEGVRDDEQVVYAADLAVDPETNMAGGRIIREFLNRYKEQYLQQGIKIPVVAKAREKTSYAIIKKQLDGISEELGIRFTVEETGEYYEGGDKMYDITIRPE